MKLEVEVLLAAVFVILTASCTTKFEGSDAEEDGGDAEEEALDAREDTAADQDGPDRREDAGDEGDTVDLETADGNDDQGQDGDVESEEEEEEEEEPVCGNGIQEGTEACDDGLNTECGECNADCTAAGSGSACGDGIVCQDTEACDDGGTDPCGPCNADCTTAGTGSACGDGIVCMDTEACDDGGTDPCGLCNTDCTGAGTGSTCGDGVVCPDAEACDDGGTDPCGPCNADCTGAGTGSTCGDGVACPDTEVCDDGHATDCGPCNADCSGAGTGSACGDSLLCPDTEVCDDGGTDPCGPCNADCTATGAGSVCGDGIVCRDTEVCDDGHATDCGACNADCTATGTGSTCGDGDFCPDTEACDDGGTDACFSCNPDCTGAGNGTTCGMHLWSNRFGDSSSQAGYGIYADNADNVIITGEFIGTVNFGGGPRSSAGGGDIFMAKFSSSGSRIWDRGYGDISANQVGTAIVTDSARNIFLGGYFVGTVNFGGGALTSAGSTDIFLAKFDESANHIWSDWYGDSGTQYILTMAIDGSENILVTGYFQGTVDFGGGALMSAGNYDILIAKFDKDGNHLWSDNYGDAGNQQGVGVITDSLDNVLMTGYFQGTVDFGCGPRTSAGGSDVFVAKLDSSGGCVWSQRFGGASDDRGYTIATDASDSVFVTGYFANTINFGGGPLTSAGGNDIFVAKFDSSGGYLWSDRYGEAGNQSGISIATDGPGNIVLTGNFLGAVDFGGGLLTSGGAEDIYVAKFDGSGNHLWSKRFGDAGSQWGNWITTDSMGNSLVVGYFGGSMDLGGGTLLSAGAFDIFVAKFGP